MKLIVTSAGLERTRETRLRLKAAVPGARVRSTGLKGIFALESDEDALELAKLVWRACAESIGHVTAVLAEVESTFEPIKEAAVRVGREQIEPEETFCFRLHKRGSHGLEQDTLKLEQEIGGSIWTALEEKYGTKPAVRLKNPDVQVIAEVLGPVTAIGISRRAWREQDPPA